MPLYLLMVYAKARHLPMVYAKARREDLAPDAKRTVQALAASLKQARRR